MYCKIGYILLFILLLLPVNTYAFDTNICLLYEEKQELKQLNDTTYDIVDVYSGCKINYDITQTPFYLLYLFVLYIIIKTISMIVGCWYYSAKTNSSKYSEIKRKYK